MLEWHPWDTQIVMTAAVAAMSCALPGVWLVLRRQSMMGDALSHTSLPGVVIAFLLTHWLSARDWLDSTMALALQPLLLGLGAVAIGVLTALLTEWIQELGNVESSAALGVVFTSFFALGLLLVRMFADDVHIDPDCVLFGQLELVVWNKVVLWGWEVPRAFLFNSGMLLFNLMLLTLFYKELRISTFDPEMASSQGIHSRWIHLVLMAVTATTLVMAFRSVGSILVVGLLIVPAATATLLANRLSTVFAISLMLAAGSAFLGHLLAKTVPRLIFVPLGFDQVQDVATAGMIAVACGLFFFLALFFSPSEGLLAKWISRLQLSTSMAADDFLTTLYRYEENDPDSLVSEEKIRANAAWIGPWQSWWTFRTLRQQGLLTLADAGYQLTVSGRERAAAVVRSHRLWETYLKKHFDISDVRLHESAHVVEHFLDPELNAQINVELDSPATDPHGRDIPPATPPTPQ